MQYVITETGQDISLFAIRQNHPNMSIPEQADLTELGYSVLRDITPPVPNEGYSYSRGPNELIDGEWTMVWVEIENLPQPELVPHSITMGQARLALFDAGLLDAVDAFLESLPSGAKERAKLEWEYRPTVLRNSALVATIAAALDIDADSLFIAAAKL